MKLTWIALAIVLTAGCGKKDSASGDNGKVASCYAEEAQSCREYRGGNLALGTKSLEDLCTVVVKSAKFTETACPTAKLIGTCAKTEGKDFFYEGYYEPPKAIEDHCKQGGGTFSTK